MATHPNYYEALGVEKTASAEQLRKAYKKLARKFHPDANADDAEALEKFKQIQTAWAVLGDETKRSNYDKYGTPDAPQDHGSGSGPQQGGQHWSYSPDGGVPFDLEELFGYGGGTRHSSRVNRPIRGQDLRVTVEIPFLLAAQGGKYDLRLPPYHGAAAETFAVTIPAGIDTGSVIRLSGKGTAGMNGGANGDLLVSLNVARHPWFRREAANVLLDVPISLSECGLGTKVDIPTIGDEIITLSIPAGTSSGMKLRLKGKGIRDNRTGETGDMFAVLKIIGPKDIDDRTRELLEELKATETTDCRSGLWGQTTTAAS